MTDTIIPLLRNAGVECFTRSEWDSPREREGAYVRRKNTHPMPPGPAPFHFLHITVTADTDTVREGADGARQVEGYGYSTPPMVSYQDLVTNEGRYFEGQSYRVKGTHTVNDKGVAGYPRDLNLCGYACALMQNVGDEVTDVQVRVVAMVFAARELAGLVRRGAPILPHRMFANKKCPGDRAVARLDEIRTLRDKYVREGLPSGLEDDVAAQDVWEHKVRETDDTTKVTERSTEFLLADAHRRAGDAAKEARKANAAVRALARALGPEVEASVEAALADAVIDVNVTVGKG